jgi:hypothetical protein
MCSSDMCKVMEKPVRRGVNPGRVTLGLIIFVLGLLMPVDRVNYFDVSAMQLFPGMVLIAMGLARMALAQVDPADLPGANPVRKARLRQRRDLRSGLWLMTIGAWLIVNGLHVFGLTYGTSWPLLVIASGVFIVARGMEK